MCVRPVSTPTTARQALSSVDCVTGGRGHESGQSVIHQGVAPFVTGDDGGVEASVAERGSKLDPALGGPSLRRPIGVGDEQDQTLGVRSVPELEGDRCREVADHPEIGPDAGDDLIDRQGAVGGRKFR